MRGSESGVFVLVAKCTGSLHVVVSLITQMSRTGHASVLLDLDLADGAGRSKRAISASRI